jgi:protein-S-isoprenylcysteine O-methyltransferase Ste14
MNAILSLLTLLSLLAWFALYWRGGLTVFSDIRAALANRQTQLDAPLLIAATLLSAGILISCAWMTLSNQAGILPPVFQVAGFPITLVGILGMFYCRRFLGKFWTAETSLQSGHKIISSGPYGLVRHPIYSFAILAYLGAGLVFSAWWNLLLTAAIIFFYVIKTYDEDKFLIENLPGYAEYAQKVRCRLVRGVW